MSGTEAGALYVIGHDHHSEEIRTFAIDRIRKIEETTERFQIPSSFDFDTYTASSFGVIAEPATHVKIRFAKAVRTFVEERTWHPSQQVETLSGGAVLLTMEVGDTTELRSWVLSFGADAEVFEPDSLRQEIAEELGKAARLYLKNKAAGKAKPRARRSR